MVLFDLSDIDESEIMLNSVTIDDDYEYPFECDCDYCSYHREDVEEITDDITELQDLEDEAEYLEQEVADSMGDVFRALDEGKSNEDVLLAIFAHEAALTRLKFFLVE
jgi:hypothetical protein